MSKVLVIEGDSNSAASVPPGGVEADTWFRRVAASYPFAGGTYINQAHGGDLSGTVDSEYAAQGGSVSLTGHEGYYSLLIGTNDIPGGTAEATLYNNLKSIWAKARASGYKYVIAWTIPFRTANTGPQEAARVAVNALILSDTTLYSYVIRADLYITDDSFLGDGTHFTLAGHALLARLFLNTLGFYAFPETSTYPASSTYPVSYNYDTQNWLANVALSGGIVSAASAALIDACIIGLKADSLWSKIQWLWIPVGDFIAARIPIKLGGGFPMLGGVIVSGDYVETGSTGGFKMNGTTKYLTTGWNPIGLSATSAHLYCYVKGTEANGTSRGILGNIGSGNINGMSLRWFNSGGAELGSIAAASAGTSFNAGTTSRDGSLCITTNGSTSQIYYAGGIAVGAGVAQDGSMQNFPIFIGCLNANGTASFFSTRYHRAACGGTGLSATDAANLHTRILAVQTGLSRN